MERSRASKEQVGSLGIVLGPQLERFVVVPLGRRKRVQSEGAVSGFSEREPGTVCEIGAVAAGGPGELERRAPVMSQHLGVVIGSAEAFDPLGDLGVLVRAVGARNLPVRDVTDERVREGDLGLIFDGGAPLPADETLALERMQRGRRGTLLATECPDPEHLSDDRCIAEEIFLLRRESVEAGGDDALECLRQRKLLRRAALEVELRELLGVERISSRSLEQGLLRLRHEHRAVEEPTDQLRGLLVRKRGDGERRGVQLAAAPADRRSRSSGRAVATTSSGTSVTHSTSSSTKSRRLSSAQWRSSKTRTRDGARPSPRRRGATRKTPRLGDRRPAGSRIRAR